MSTGGRDPEVKGIPVPFSVRMAMLNAGMMRLNEAVWRAKRGECNWDMVRVYVANVTDDLEHVRNAVRSKVSGQKYRFSEGLSS